MDTSDVTGFLKKAMPWIGAAATGNVPVLVAMAAKAVGDAMGTTVDPTPTAISQVIAGATPEDMLKLKQAEDDFMVRMQELNYKQVTELYAAEVADRNGARDREIKTGDKSNRNLAYLIVLAWVLIQAFLMTHVIDVGMRDLISRVLGTLDASLTMVLSYYFGSSKGSERKTEIIGAAAAK